ncbi:MAG TPA: tetratricopeptide repeat protein [Blastocatellia bacterium]|nr:tetratricopeptide repeat protein [Blastocatellia bacterium]
MASKQRKRTASRKAGGVSGPARARAIGVQDKPEPETQQPVRNWLSTRSKWTYTLAPVLLAVLVSFNTMWNGWVADDHTQIRSNAQIRKLSNIPLSFTTSVWSYATGDDVLTIDTYYRPIFMALFTINYAIAGLAPWAWHLINLLIHAAATLLVFFTIKELTSRLEIASLTAALFAVHPVHAESVAWVSGITDPLTALFLLPAFWFYLRFRKTGQKKLLILVAVFYLLALFGKETALALPLVIAYCELFHFKERAPLKVRVIGAVLLPALLIAPTAVYLAMRYVTLKGALFGTGPRYPMAYAMMTVPLAILKYLKLMFLPWGQSYQHYTDFVSSIGASRFLLPLAGVLVVVAAIVLTRSRLFIFGSVWFIVFLAPALASMRQFDPEYLLQDRYLYLPSIGFCLGLALMIDWLAQRWGRKAGIAAAVVLLAAYSVADVRQNGMWKDGQTIFENCVDTDPTSHEAHLSIGRIYYELGRVRDGEEHALKALELAPASPNPYLLLAYFARTTGKLDKSIDYLERGIAAVPETPITRFKLATMYLNLGLLKAQTKNLAEAEHHMLRSIEVWPRSTGWLSVGLFYFEQGRYEEALAMFLKTRSSVPERYALIHVRLGQVYDKLGQIANARAEYQRYLDLSPDASDSGIVKGRLSALAQ